MKIKIEISVGELLDKISILSIKRDKIKDSEKLIEINRELLFLEQHGNKIRSQDDIQYDNFLKKLILINSKLWDIEDKIRVLEKKSAFKDEFISLARNVYFTNDERFECKNEINNFYGSEMLKSKST